MNWTIIKNIGEFIQNYTGNEVFGYVRLVIDVLLILAAVIFVYRIFMRYTNNRILWFLTGALLLLFVLIIGLDLQILYALYPYIVCIVVAVWIFYNAGKLKTVFGDMVKYKNTKNFVLDESSQEELISTLIKSVEYLSSRQIGAIITIEKQDSLNTYINKGTKLDAEISFELLSTIFMPGTALHDGAVIIRGKHVMSAGAFYPSTDKNDIPKNYGSRHRAAIGISEVTDAFTIVVSEETGKVALTLDGTITPDVSLESLRVYLKQNIIVE
ncbi:MAG: diadenylate cyclase CdaA [Bacilli bacterium]|nr:diadenylate cyclase CdaA [Bacilli bacterium]